MKTCAGLVILLAWVLAGSIPAASGHCESNQSSKLVSAEAFAMDEFGAAVAISGNLALIGVPLDGDGGEDYGSAYLYRFDGLNWNFEAKLTAPDAERGDEFGISVALSGEVAVIGAHFDDDRGRDSGSAYLFQFDGQAWRHVAKLTAAGGIAYDNFGIAVAIDGDLVAVGANLGGSSNKGAVFVYVKPPGGWSTATQTARLMASDAEASDEFGVSVAVSGDVVVAGTEYEASGGTASGAAYLFQKPAGGWVNMTDTAKFTASDATEHERFGHSVAIDGDVVVVGAWATDQGGVSTGSLYVFQKPASGWADATETAKLTASHPLAGDHLGWSVAIRGDLIVGGAPAHLWDGTGNGSAFIFWKPAGGWEAATEEAKLTAPDGAEDDEFGFAVALHEGRAVIGARRQTVAGYDNAGSAYTFRGLADCQPNASLDLCDIASGASQDSDNDGLPDECAAPGPGAGAVDSLFVDLSTGGLLSLSWEPSCLFTDDDFEIYEGALGDFTSHTALFCTTGGETEKTFLPGPGNRYYLLVPRNAGAEGSYGLDSEGCQREAGQAPCLPQTLGLCP